MIYTSIFPLVRATSGSRGFDLKADLRDLDGFVDHISKLNPGVGIIREKGIDSESNQIIIPPFKPVRIPTSLRIDYWDISIARVTIGFDNVSADIKPNSRALFKNGVYVQLGTIDSDYRGDHLVCLTSLVPEPIIIKHGQVIAQLEFIGITPENIEKELHWVESAVFEKQATTTQRGNKGFGHSETK